MSFIKIARKLAKIIRIKFFKIMKINWKLLFGFYSVSLNFLSIPELVASHLTTVALEYISVPSMAYLELPWWLSGEESACNSGAAQDTVWSLGQQNPLEKGTATHSSILAWKIPWIERPGGLQSTGSQIIGHHWSNLEHTHTAYLTLILFSKSSWIFIRLH